MFSICCLPGCLPYCLSARPNHRRNVASKYTYIYAASPVIALLVSLLLSHCHDDLLLHASNYSNSNSNKNNGSSNRVLLHEHCTTPAVIFTRAKFPYVFLHISIYKRTCMCMYACANGYVQMSLWLEGSDMKFNFSFLTFISAVHAQVVRFAYCCVCVLCCMPLHMRRHSVRYLLLWRYATVLLHVQIYTTHKHTLELVCTCIGLFVISCLSLKSKLICRVCARRSFGLRLAHCPLCAPGLFYALTLCFVVALHAFIVCVNFVDNL